MRSMVEGAAHMFNQTLGDRRGIVQDLACGNSQDREAARLQLRAAHLVPPCLSFGLVHAPIDLDDECSLTAKKIDDIGLDRMLPPELDAARTEAQMLPKQDLGQRHLSPEATGGVDCGPQ